MKRFMKVGSFRDYEVIDLREGDTITIGHWMITPKDDGSLDILHNGIHPNYQMASAPLSGNHILVKEFRR